MNLRDTNEINSDRNELREAIFKVVAFFDMFDCPLTAFEIWKYLPVKCELDEVMAALNESRIMLIPLTPFRRGLESKNGFYFLPSRNVLYDLRMARYNFTSRKFGQAIKIACIFKLVPWIKMIALSNIIGANNAKEGSDIDLFILTENKKIWLTRFFCLTILKLFGLRPTTEKQKDKICLSFFISEGAMDLKKLMLDASAQKEYKKPERLDNDKTRPSFLTRESTGTVASDTRYAIRDTYFIYWLACLVPIYDRDETYARLLGSNRWFGQALPNWEMTINSNWRDIGRPLSFFYRDLVDIFCGGLEKFFMKQQMKRLPGQIKNMINKDTRVVVNEEIIKTHTNDRREEYREKFLAKLNEINNKF